MKEKKCLNLRRSLLLIVAVLLISSCICTPEVIEKQVLPPLPSSPLIPFLTWVDIPGYYDIDKSDLSEYSRDELKGLLLNILESDFYAIVEMDFTDLQEFFDLYEGYQEKMQNIKGE